MHFEYKSSFHKSFTKDKISVIRPLQYFEAQVSTFDFYIGKITDKNNNEHFVNLNFSVLPSNLDLMTLFKREIEKTGFFFRLLDALSNSLV